MKSAALLFAVIAGATPVLAAEKAVHITGIYSGLLHDPAPAGGRQRLFVSFAPKKQLLAAALVAGFVRYNIAQNYGRANYNFQMSHSPN